MCDDIQGFVERMRDKNVPYAPITEQRWGRITEIALPSGAKLGVYQPKHPRPDTP